MSYLDRLRDLRYVSPSGVEIVADFEELSRSGGKKAAIHEIPQSDRAIVQDLGAQADRFTLRLYVQGADYDKTADALYAAIKESNPGTLKHARWGDLPALALTYAQREGFVEGMGEAVFDVEFIHAPSPNAPASNASSAAAISSASDAAASASAAAAAAAHGTPDLAKVVACKQRIKQGLRAIKQASLSVTGLAATVQQTVAAEIASILNDIDAILAVPATLYATIARIPSDISKVSMPIANKLAAYGVALESISGMDTPTTEPEAALTVAFAESLAIGAAAATTVGTLASRAAALAAHDTIVDIFAAALHLIEAAEAASEYVADPEVVSSLEALQAQTAQYLLGQSYSLRVERRVTLTAAATPLDLIYRFYGDVSDDLLDEFCDANHLQGDALNIVAAGTEVLYYAE